MTHVRHQRAFHVASEAGFSLNRGERPNGNSLRGLSAAAIALQHWKLIRRSRAEAD